MVNDSAEADVYTDRCSRLGDSACTSQIIPEVSNNTETRVLIGPLLQPSRH